MSEESHATLREDRKCPMGCPTFAGEKSLIFFALPDVCCNVLVIRAF